MWTRPRTVLMIAYRDWLSKPTIEKKMLDRRIRTRWYKIIESTESTRNILGPQIKLSENNNCVANNKERNIGAITVAGRGMRKTSLVSILNKSANIWKAPLRPIRVGPIRRWANASNLRSVKTTNRVNNITNKEDIKAASCKI